MKRIGILTSGGDCPGLNAVLRGAVRAATSLGWEVLGFKDGYEGLLNGGDYMILDRKNTMLFVHREKLQIIRMCVVVCCAQS